MIVGPPGTGKTDVAVQTIVNLYHSFPNQKILLVTHSNAALNDLFRKIMARNVDPRHLLRLGSGEKSLMSNEDGTTEYDEQFSKQGRVNWSLSRRMELLAEVQRLAASLGVAGDVGSSCETADYFFVEHIQPRIDKFRNDIAGTGTEVSAVMNSFPFRSFFSDVPEPLFSDSTMSYDHAKETTNGCIRHLSNLFEELADYRAFELLRSQAHRADYLLTKQVLSNMHLCTHT
jgi:intron-binding protein aquarius